ncbi:MAG: DsrE family protein [Clostridiales bacterium]|nr:DsrE family protein [Clostridiales bacterium]
MDKLNILWTTDNKDTVFNMLSMYAINSLTNKWWDDVNLIIWGASAKLIGNDTQVQTEIIEMIKQGVSLEACKDCCDNFGVTDKLTSLGINVRYMGKSLTDYIKSGEKILSI